MEIMLPSLREERAQTYSPFLPISPETGIVLQVPIDRARRQGRHDHLERSRHRGARRPRRSPAAMQAAMEARLGDALGRARHRLRDGRQGPDRLGQALRRDLPRARRHAAGRLQLRALPRRQGPEDLQVEGQRAHHRRVAALRLAGEPVAVHVSRAEGGEAALFRRHPARTSTSISSSSTAISARTASSGSRNPVWHIHSGNPPKADMPITFRCCSRWCRHRMPRTPRRCGASSAATGRA